MVKDAFEGLPEDLDLVEHARKRGGDSLGLALDPELLVHLVNSARRRFLTERTPQAFQDWADLFRDYSEAWRDERVEDPGGVAWSVRVSLELERASRLDPVFVRPKWLDIDSIEARLSDKERQRIADQFDFLWLEAAVKTAR